MRITANQVTFARLVCMPFLGVLLYYGHAATIWAVVLGTLVGCTDFVDGWLARRQGPTVLGGLMDPIADKLFIVFGFFPSADLGYFAWWPVALIFLREFLVTALRSSFEQRHLQLKTTYLAKVKTWAQMCGIGLLFLQLAGASRLATLILCGVASGGALAGGVVALLLGRRWRGAWIFFASFAALFATYWYGTPAQYRLAVVVTIIAITWASGLDYLVVAARELARARDFHLFDTVRIAGAIALPVLSLLVLTRTGAPAWTVTALIAIELAHGGLDNLLAHHGAAAGPLAWGGRVLGASAFLGAALALPAWAGFAAAAALSVSVAGTTAAFYRNRRFYLDEKLREKKRGKLKKSSSPAEAA